MKFIMETGEVAKDPVEKSGGEGQYAWRMAILSVKETEKTKKGERHHFWDFVCWGDLAEWVLENVRAGHSVIVKGDLKQVKDKTTGKYRPSPNATDVRIAGGKEVIDDAIRMPEDDNNEFALPFSL